jgi:hypothetical protein
MLAIEIKITSPSTEDMELALKEVLRLISEGNTRGWGNDGCKTKTDYTFMITGEAEEIEDEDEE